MSPGRCRGARPSVAAVAAVALAAAAVACGDGGHEASPPTSASPATSQPPGTETAETTTPGTTAAPRPLAEVAVRLTRIADLDQPVALATRPGDDALYLAEKGGRVRAVRDRAVAGESVLDLSGQVSTGSEQGLLGLVFSPDGERMFVNYTDRAGDTHVVEYGFSGGRGDPATARELLLVRQPYANHNGGNLVFGPDGHLWIGLGDGGAGNDPMGNAQNLGTLLGKMLRIDSSPSGGRPYGIPPDNPFVGQAGARPEIWSYGLRNPWRYSFDRETGDRWVGDVGQGAREEVNFAPAGDGGGQNWGWPAVEGRLVVAGDPPAGAVAPIYDYSHQGGACSVVGGYVYRGSRIPGLTGAYLFGDYCLGEVVALRQSGGRVVEEARLGLPVPALSSFGEDAAGELYALSLDGPVYRIDPA